MEIQWLLDVMVSMYFIIFLGDIRYYILVGLIIVTLSRIRISLNLLCVASRCSHGDIRLYAGYALWEGFPEVCIYGQWTKICRTNWDIQDTNTLCQQLLNTQNNIRKFMDFST